jgi:hypothetical protein
MSRTRFVSLTGAAVLSVVLAGAAFATPLINGATIEIRTFNDCPLSVVTVVNQFPDSIQITDEMDSACLGFANRHGFSFSGDGGATAAVFDNDSGFRFGADVRIDGAGEGEGGLRLSPWWSQFVDGQFMADVTTGEIACFGGRLPYYNFTAEHGISYARGTTIHMEIVYRPNGLSAADPGTILYRVVMGGTTYESPEIPFDEGNPAEDPPYGLWGILNDARAGGYFQPRANTGEALSITWSDISFAPLGTPCPDAASIEIRTFNDCPLSIVTVANFYPDTVAITDLMDPACLGFANLHSFSFSEDGGFTPAVFNNASEFSFGADLNIDGAGEGEGGLRISPWWAQYVDGRFMANVTSGEIACFGGRLPFYSFTADQGISYTRGTTIRMEVVYEPNGLSAADPATILYRVIMDGSIYESPLLPFDQGTATEDPPYGRWGILNDARVGGYFQPWANTGAALTATWSNIAFSSPACGCVDTAPPTVDVAVSPDVLWPPNHKYVDVCATVTTSDDCDPAPSVSLMSVSSSEPDDGDGDGSTVDDIVIDENDCFRLRAERQGGGDGRVYTITYCATDAAGNVGCGEATVTVPHDRSGTANASLGFSPDGTAFEPGVGRFAIVIPSTPDLDAGIIDAPGAVVGNWRDNVPPVDVEYADLNGDGRADLRLYYETEPVQRILDSDSTPALRYRNRGGDFYLVSDIFALGTPIEGATVGVLPGEPPVTVSAAHPNPFRSSTMIRYTVNGEAARVAIAIYDPSGRLVRTLVDAVQAPGSHTAVWDGIGKDGVRAAAGVYFLRTDVAGVRNSERVVLIK